MVKLLHLEHGVIPFVAGESTCYLQKGVPVYMLSPLIMSYFTPDIFLRVLKNFKSNLAS